MKCSWEGEGQTVTGKQVKVEEDLQSERVKKRRELIKEEIPNGEFKRGGEIVATFFWRRRSALRRHPAGPIGRLCPPRFWRLQDYETEGENTLRTARRDAGATQICYLAGAELIRMESAV